jgi:hypothetical protein
MRLIPPMCGSRAWQKRFVQTCVEDHRLHGKARYLLADDVGLGKTLSMAAAALVLSLLEFRSRRPAAA